MVICGVTTVGSKPCGPGWGVDAPIESGCDSLRSSLLVVVVAKFNSGDDRDIATCENSGIATPLDGRDVTMIEPEPEGEGMEILQDVENADLASGPSGLLGRCKESV